MGVASIDEAARLVRATYVCPGGIFWRCPGPAACSENASSGTDHVTNTGWQLQTWQLQAHSCMPKYVHSLKVRGESRRPVLINSKQVCMQGQLFACRADAADTICCQVICRPGVPAADHPMHQT